MRDSVRARARACVRVYVRALVRVPQAERLLAQIIKRSLQSKRQRARHYPCVLRTTQSTDVC